MRTHVTTACVIATTIALAACSEGTSSRGIAPVSLAMASAASTAAPAAAAAAATETFTDGTNTLVISSVEVVLRKVELKRADAAAPAGCAMSTSGITASDDGACDDNEHADELEAGPALVNLPLGGVERTFTAVVPAGTFDALQFQIHKPSSHGDAADQDFLKAHPDFAGISIKVKGTFNGADFTYTSDLSVGEKLKFDPPAVVTAGTPASVTIKLDLDGWFRSGGGALVDPATAGLGAKNEDLVRHNIIRSFHAFQDNDEDGMDDGQEGHDDGGHDGEH